MHIKEKKKNHFLGTVGFSSLNSHSLKEQSRRDDMESLAYLIIYLKSGKLPWHGVPRCETRLERYNMIVKKKFETKPEELITQDMPYELYLFYQYCKDLSFDQRPDYGYLHRLLRDLIYSESFQFVIAFQWLVPDQQHYKQAKTSNDSGRALNRRMGSVEGLGASAGLTQNRRPFQRQ